MPQTNIYQNNFKILAYLSITLKDGDIYIFTLDTVSVFKHAMIG